MRLFKIEGIILKRKNLGEADRMLTIFTKEYGKLRVMAKGIRRVISRRAPHLEAFSRVKAMIHRGKAWDSLSEVEALDTFPCLRQDLWRIGTAYYLVEIVDQLLAERQEHRDIYALLVEALGELATGGRADADNLSQRFTQTVLTRLGFLAQGKTLDMEELQTYIEGIIEKKLRVSRICKSFT